MHAHYNSMNNVNHIRTFYLLHAYILSSKISLPASLKTRNHWGFKQSVVLSTRELQFSGSERHVGRVLATGMLAGEIVGLASRVHEEDFFGACLL